MMISALLLVLMVLWTPSAHACQICVPLPQQTLADHLLESDVVVMAREDPNRPFHYAAVEVIKGDLGQEVIDTFMNSQARRMLAADPANAMVLARSPREDNWIALGITQNGDFEKVIRLVLERDDWNPNDRMNVARVTEFATLLSHSDRRLFELAYLEVGRAPYSMIKAVSPMVSVEKLRAMLDDFQYSKWHALAILLLGQSDNAIDRERVYAHLKMMHEFGVDRNLAAWATACIEMNGVAGLKYVSDFYFDGPEHSSREYEQIIMALSTHGKANSKIRDQIIDVYHKLMSSNPKIATRFVQDLIIWKRWEFVEEYQQIKRIIGHNDPLGNYAINQYLHAASVANKSSS